MDSFDRLPRRTFRLVLYSCLWAFAGLGLALHAPWDGRDGWPASGDLIPLGGTGGLLLTNAILAVMLVGASGRTWEALPNVLCLILLFGVLFFQVGCHLGMDHYHWEQTPDCWDWVAFPAVHVLRAVDLLDVLEAYPLPIQLIHPASLLTKVLAVLLQGTVGLFFLSLLLEGVRAGWRVCAGYYQAFPAGARSVFALPGIYAAIAGLTGVLAAVYARQAPQGQVARSWLEHGRWAVDQLMQVLDLGDAMPILELSLHRQEGSWWMTLEGVLLRAVMAVLLLLLVHRLGRYVSLRYLGGWGLGLEEVQKLHRQGATLSVRVLASKRLFQLHLATHPRRWPVWGVLGASVLLGLCMTRVQPGWTEASLRLAVLACLDTQSASPTSLRSLRRMGSYGEAAIAVLGAHRLTAPPGHRLALLETLAHLGPRAIPLLEEGLVDTDPEVARRCAHGLSKLGPRAVSILVGGFGRSAKLDELLRSALLEMGKAGVPPLMALLSPQTAPELVPLLEEIEPGWYRQDPGTLLSRRVRTARLALEMLLEPEKATGNREYWSTEDPTRIVGTLQDPTQLTPYLLDLGPISARAVPILVELLEKESTTYGSGELLTGLERLGPTAKAAAPALRRMLGKRQGAERIAETLARWDGKSRPSGKGR